uniref:Uncharacterized protein n=1 Tax=Oryza sativa subsp. japonica TaxID=39947 RepID=Q6K4J0_ORYSJ|nr:hypothetical protein [Oryza sativa Japonica Group]
MAAGGDGIGEDLGCVMKLAVRRWRRLEAAVAVGASEELNGFLRDVGLAVGGDKGGDGGLLGGNGEGGHGVEEEAAGVVEHAVGGDDRDEEGEGGRLGVEAGAALFATQ